MYGTVLDYEMIARVKTCGKTGQVISCLVMLAAANALGGRLHAQVLLDTVPETKDVGITEHLGARIPSELAFTDDHGVRVKLGDYFGDGKPVVLNLVYYQCPMLCNLVLNGVAAAAGQVQWTPGNEFRMIAISINPRETSELAAAKKVSYLRELGRPNADNGWSFLVGDSTQSRALADALGWRYRYDDQAKEYVHAAATFVLSPDGTISRYLYGIEYEPRDLRLALLEASEGKIGNTLDKLILFCFHYDPNARGYVLFAQNLMKIGGAGAALILGVFLVILWRRELRVRRQAAAALQGR